VVEELLVVAHHVVVEHGDVAAGGLQVRVHEQDGADVDRTLLLTSSAVNIRRKSCGVNRRPANSGCVAATNER
jgi:hypothetical protein